ncbi:MAG TPA: FAD-binding protein, partial [Herpetosiphonaceae bacterium]|nr:FAD-binding protein [Herpetosiphonaceae bacterium]
MPLFEHAIVIGGSIAGSLAARVLAGQSARVTVIERDRYPAEADHRAGVPQSHHVHILLVRGLELMEGLLPGFKDELIRQGGRQGSLLRQNPTFLYRNWIPLPKQDLEGMAASRPLIETVLRQMIIRQCPQIVWETEHQAVNLVVAEGRVRGVEVQAAGQNSQRRILSADVVVDASGRDSNLPDWLERLGYRLPPPTVVNAHVGYTTGWFEPPAGARRVDWEGLIVRSPANPTMRSAVIA